MAARTTSVALTHQKSKDNPADPKRLAEAAAAVARLAATLNQQLIESAVPAMREILLDEPGLGGALTTEMLFADSSRKAVPATSLAAEPSSDAILGEHSTLGRVYAQLDLPLVPVLLRMEQVGVRIDPALLREMSSRLAVTIDDLAERVYASVAGAGNPPHRFNITPPSSSAMCSSTRWICPSR